MKILLATVIASALSSYAQAGGLVCKDIKGKPVLSFGVAAHSKKLSANVWVSEVQNYVLCTIDSTLVQKVSFEGSGSQPHFRTKLGCNLNSYKYGVSGDMVLSAFHQTRNISAAKAGTLYLSLHFRDASLPVERVQELRCSLIQGE